VSPKGLISPPSDYQASTLPLDHKARVHPDFFDSLSTLQCSFDHGARESRPNAAKYISIGAKNTIAYKLGLLCLSLLWVGASVEIGPSWFTRFTSAGIQRPSFELLNAHFHQN